MGVTEANVSEFALGLCFAAVDGSLKPEKLVVALLATDITKSKLVDAIVDAAWYVPLGSNDSGNDAGFVGDPNPCVAPLMHPLHFMCDCVISSDTTDVKC